MEKVHISSILPETAGKPLTNVKLCGKLNTITRNAFMVVGIQPFFLQKSMLKIFQNLDLLLTMNLVRDTMNSN